MTIFETKRQSARYFTLLAFQPKQGPRATQIRELLNKTVLRILEKCSLWGYVGNIEVHPRLGEFKIVRFGERILSRVP